MSEAQYEGIAIVGMAGRFPGAESIEELWANLVAGKESITFFSDAELAESGLDASTLRRRGRYIPARGVLKDADCFDAAFFGIHPKEAEVMDPQQRVFLETCWSALERAGYAPSQLQNTVGVFGGVTFNTYYLQVLQPRPDLVELVGPEQVMLGNEKDYLTTRVAYKLGLKGPALNVSTACSTSLVAICQACQSLLTYQCDMALAGGASVRVPQKSGYFYDEGNIGSSDGHTRTFDAQAAGTVFSNGAAVVVLKRLEDAVHDGDQIYAVIKGAALNNDGSQRVSFGAPGVEGQSKVIALAHALAGIEPDTITCIEAHGTATPLGDPIEVTALTKAFRLGTDKKQFCAIGSVKTNLGHLDAAAGVAGLIKMALSLHHKKIPASLHFTKPNPKLELENSPFYVNASLQDWQAKPGVPRRAGVSSFGTGGTNAHVVLEEAPEMPASGPSRPWQLLMLSAKTPDALDRATANLSGHLTKLAGGEAGQRDLADAAFTLQSGRSEFVHRRIVACRDAADGVAALEARDPKRVFTHQQQLRDLPVVFMFPGQGAQYPGMGAELYRTEQVFRTEIQRCAELLRPTLQTDIRELLFPAAGSEKAAEARLIQTRFTQPALFVIEYALARLWMSWGIRPTGMIGHSVGEYVAGCLAGVFTLEDALSLVARRGALVQAQPGGAMLAVRLPEQDVVPLLNPELAVAAINSPSLCVVSGPFEAIAEFEKQLEAKRIVGRRLHTSHAFHSPMMEPVLAPFTDLLRRVKLGVPQIPYVSNVTARWITPDEATSPEYWAGHVRDTVRFADGVAELMKDPRNVLLEVGPGQTLSTLSRQHPAKPAEQAVLASLALSGDQEARGILETLGRLWMAGVKVDWQGFYAGQNRRRTVLPTYPFERKRYWPEPLSSAGSVMLAAAAVATAGGAPAPQPGSAEVQPVELPTPAMSSQTALELAVPRKNRLLDATRSLLQELSGYDLAGVDPSASLLELGLDSLLLTQASQLFQRKFGISITFRQLMEELSSLDAIATHLDENLSPDAFAPAPAIPAPVAPSVNSPAVTPSHAPSNAILEQLLQQQQQLTNQLMQLLGGQPSVVPAITVAQPASAPVVLAPAKSEVKSHGPFKPIDKSAAAMTPDQARALEAFIARYTKRTPGSKRLTAENRSVLADPRSVAGFNRLWKEMVYPIVTNRSDGSRVWDVDNNEYVDFVMGFGASLFGHRPAFVVQAVHEQLDRGFEIGPIQPLAGEVAGLMKEFTGMPRVAFTNTGSEAVLAATRVSRTVTGRDKIAVFAGAYHGIFDEVLFRPLTVNGETRTAPIAPGVPNSAVGQVMVLEYGNPQSLDILRARGSEIAAVLVEPVQSRRLDLQPREFMHELRRITRETGSALIFDEVVTGFRVHPGGAQAYFDVRADLATYGKVVGGGMPIGVVAGDPKYMDALDGGQWRYGDNSFPEVGVTFFAGTFVRHPLVLAAAKSVLLHLKQQGPGLQQGLSQRTERTAQQLQAILEQLRAPYHLTQFSSIMHLSFPSDQKFAGLLFYMLRERGIHIYENRAFILTTAHSDADLDKLQRALRESLVEMQISGFLPGPGSVPKVAKPGDVVARRADQTSVSAAQPGPTGKFPLTESQKEIWLAAQMGGDAALAYNESLKLEFHGEFDLALFRSAVQQVVQRHPILLASFAADGEWQEIKAETRPDVPLIDLSAKPESDRERERNAIIETEVSEAFDLAAGPLVRVRMVRLAKDHHLAIWTAHHIVCDGWSGGLIVSELASIYSALKQGAEAQLEAPLSFRAYAATANEDTDIRGALHYWRQQFQDVPPPLELPADRPRPLVRTAQASTVKRDFGATLHQSIKRTAGQQRTTLVVLMMAALKTMLHRLSGQSDVVLGLGVAGQAVTGNTCLVGHCVNLLPIRTRLQPAASFAENLAAVKKGVLDAYDHYQCTLGSILQHLKVPRSTGRPPLVEVIFNVDRDPAASEFQGVEFDCDRNPKRALHFDLFFNVVEGPRGMYVECDYNTDLFDASTIERWLTHYQTVLEGIVASPTEKLSQLPLLSEDQRRELLVDWNRTEAEFPKQTLHELIERQAWKTPGASAVTFETTTISYSELNRRANQLAHYLQALGVGPDKFVGVFLDRSIEMVVAVLGTLKAGGAYLPLDPEYPKDRLAFMLEDADVPVLLTNSSLAGQLPGHRAQIFCFDTDKEHLDREPDTNPSSTVSPGNLAYVIYTSGSTGKPKGVPNTHQGIVNRLWWMQSAYQLDDTDRVLQKTPYSFDVSVWEFFWPLMTGACLVVARPQGHKDPHYLMETIQNHKITTLHFVPSMLRMFLDSEGVERCASVRQVFCSGETLPFDLQKRFFQRMNSQLHNLYGPTEAAVDVTYWQCAPESGRSIVPIGKPIANTQIYILDPLLQPTPVGVPGELHIGGVGLARGYLKRPELTAQKFIADPFSQKPGARLYKTGDLARFLPDGNIEYLGRLDHQVKLRGFRIELGEIEAALDSHPGVQQSVVIAREDEPNDKRLVAYIQQRADSSPSIADLRAHLKNDLPDYMVPSAFVFLDELPLTTSGKIDRKALPAPDEQRVERKAEAVAPRDPLEQMLTQLWSKVLKVKPIGLNDNFFELGGHSLLAVRIITEIEKGYHKRLPLATLLQAQTIAALAEVLRREHWEPSWHSLVPVRPGGSRPPFFLMHSHGGNVLEYYPLANHLDADQPVYALQARGLDGRIVKGQSLEDMAAFYLDELRSLQPEGPYFLGGFCFGGLLALEAAQQLTAAGQQVALVVMIQTMNPAAARFRPDTSRVQRWRYRATKRIDLERENFSHRGAGYIQHRLQHGWSMAGARAAIALDRITGNGRHEGKRPSMAYVLESLSMEHDKVFYKYQPRPYAGDVLLIRASKQMPGLIADESLGWKRILKGNLEILEVDGHQQNILIDPKVSSLAEQLSTRLESAQMCYGTEVGV